jgi:predicted RNase H-like nuclease
MSVLEKVNGVLKALESAELRCTYNALAEYCGLSTGVVIQCLGERRPLASWIVNKDTLRPSYYRPDQEHPNLYQNARVISNVKDLEEVLAGGSDSPSSIHHEYAPAKVDTKSAGDVLCYGVDGCKGGWIYACIGGNEVQFGTVKKLIDLVEKAPAKSRIFVDIPIGLHDSSGEGRKCDVEGRRLLRPYRTSSVFNAPIRKILDEPNYEAANGSSKRLSGKGLTQQTFNIIPKIREVDHLMASSGKARELVREVHPEVCFYGLAGGRPMEYSKKTKEGFQSRLNILVGYQPGVEGIIERALSHYPRSVVAADDILDALVCAVTARMSDRWRTVPERPERDSKGLPMEMVYCLP